MSGRAVWIGVVLASFAAALGGPIHGQSDRPTTDFVILKRDDLAASTVRLTIIVVGTKSEADSIRSKLDAGTSFEALAREYSRHPSAVTSGEFGEFALSDLQPEFQTALTGVKSGGYTQAFAIAKPATPSGWPENIPSPGIPLTSVERALGRSYSSTTLPADAGSRMTELMYPFGVRLRIHESRGLGFMEFTPPWKSTIFGIRPDDQMPGAVLDLFPRTGRFIRGVFVGVPDSSELVRGRRRPCRRRDPRAVRRSQHLRKSARHPEGAVSGMHNRGRVTFAPIF